MSSYDDEEAVPGRQAIEQHGLCKLLARALM